MPRASLLVGPTGGFSFSASVGRGVRSIDPSYVTQDVATPFASILAYEGGVAYAGGVGPLGLTARSVVFQTKVDRDLIFSETAGRNLLGGGTTRTGWTGAVRATGDFLDLAANVTLVRSTFDDTHLLVPYVPDLVVRGDGALFGDLPLPSVRGQRFRGTLGAGVTYVGHRPLPYGQRSDAIGTVDVAATVGLWHVDVGLTATNLFDSRYRLGEYDYASDFRSSAAPTLVPVRHFSAGPPRTVMATFAVTLGGNP